MAKTLQEINDKISDGSVNVITADKMPHIVEELGPEGAAKEVDVVTTGTFGAMCSSGVWMNFGHADPPIKMSKVWLNDVEAYAGVAAVDAYIGATQLSETRGLEYGGAHVIEDLVAGREVELKAVGFATDCYPRRSIETSITLNDLNEAIMLNPRNAYQKYTVATNSTDKVIYTYMGTLLPKFGNATYSASGTLSPLYNDPEYETIGVGTRIYLCGAEGYVIGHGTQHDPINSFGTLMVRGDLKAMNSEHLRAATLHKYGTSLYTGIGIPIPILNEGLVGKTAITDAEIMTDVLDYGVGRRARPVIRKVSYEELKSGTIEINGKEVRTSSMSSYFKAKEIANALASRIKNGRFQLTAPVLTLPLDVTPKPMRQISKVPLVREVMTPGIIIRQDLNVQQAAKIIVEKQVNHLPVVSADGMLIGIVTAYDISKAVARNRDDALNDIMTKRVITAVPDEPIDLAARRLERHNISALPVVDSSNKVIGLITSEDLSKLLACRSGDGMKIILKFPQNILQNPLIAEVVLETGVLINIDRAFVDATVAEIVIDVPEGKEATVMDAFRRRAVEVRALDTPLLFDETECVQCGACVSVCPLEVFKFNDDRTISIDLKRCVLCRTCLTMCPHGALKLTDV